MCLAGLGEEVSASSHPRRIKSTKERHFVRAAAGKAHSLALTGSGRVYSWGAGTFGALGQPLPQNHTAPAANHKMSSASQLSSA